MSLGAYAHPLVSFLTIFPLHAYTMDYTFRPAREADAPALSGIYAPYVAQTAVSFEYVPPSPDEFALRIRDIMRSYPFIVALDDTGTVVGYIYAHALHERQAFAYCAEASIYIRKEHHHQGLARRLYSHLENALRQQGILQLYVSIATTDRNDPYVSCASLDAHRRLGFEEVGRFDACGWKFGRWYDLVWMRKRL